MILTVLVQLTQIHIACSISCPTSSTHHLSVMSEIQSQREHLEALLKKLGGLIKNLPTLLLCRAKETSIVKHFSNLEHDKCKGPYYTFNNAWEYIFQVADDEKPCLILRGKHGLNLIQAYVIHFSKVPVIELNRGLHLVSECIDASIQVIEAV